MCHASCIVFVAKNLDPKEVSGKRVIEVGSKDVNGSVRPIIESWGPAEYLGIDTKKGTGVDIICDAEEIVERFGKEKFDVVISTELLEHVKNWRGVLSNIKNICKVGGIILITVRSHGFDYHTYPYDYWRYELEDIAFCFRDCEILVLERDHQAPGVFAKVRKPNDFCEQDLYNYSLYSMVCGKRVLQLTDKDFRGLYFTRLVLREKLKNLAFRIGKLILSKI
jgi:SAM-dependent methyltransferase